MEIFKLEINIKKCLKRRHFVVYVTYFGPCYNITSHDFDPWFSTALSISMIDLTGITIILFKSLIWFRVSSVFTSIYWNYFIHFVFKCMAKYSNGFTLMTFGFDIAGIKECNRLTLRVRSKVKVRAEVGICLRWGVRLVDRELRFNASIWCIDDVLGVECLKAAQRRNC